MQYLFTGRLDIIERQQFYSVKNEINDRKYIYDIM